MEAESSSSFGYAERLSRGHYRGTLNLQSVPDPPLLVLRKVKILADMFRAAEKVVLHTGAGLSTACGIKDFRGPEGIWTNEAKQIGASTKGVKSEAFYANVNADMNLNNEDESKVVPRKRPREELNQGQVGRRSSIRRRQAVNYNEEDNEGNNMDSDTDCRDEEKKMSPALKEAMSWASLPKPTEKSVPNAVPSLAHMVMATMVREDFVQCIVTQNVDNLHTRSGVQRDKLAELHGNLMVEYCSKCRAEYERDFEIQSAGFKKTGNSCLRCGNTLTDKALDWDDQLPEPDLSRASSYRLKADLHIAVGTSCQMDPSRDLLYVPKEPLRTVIINLSRTERDDRAGLVIRARADLVFALLARELRIPIEPYVHNSVLSLVVRPVGSGENRRAKFGKILFGLQTGLGLDKELRMPIPFVREVSYDVNGHDFFPFESNQDLACALDCSNLKDPVLTIRAKFKLLNNETEFIELKYVGDEVSESKSIIVNRVEYADDAEKHVNFVLEKANDAALNMAYLESDDVNIWFMVDDKKLRHYRCTICNTAQIFRGGAHASKNFAKHVRSCLAKQFKTA